MKRAGGLAVAAFVVVSAMWAGCSSDASTDAPPAGDDAGDDVDVTPDAGTDAPDFGAPSTTYPAFMPSVPQTVSAGGTVMKDFTVVPVVYAGDTVGVNAADFLAKYAASATYAAQAADYGLGTMTIAPTVTISDAAPSTLAQTDLQSWLRDRLDGTHPEWGANDGATLAKTVFVLVYPSGTTITRSATDVSCSSFGGFHGRAAFVNGADAGTSMLPTDAQPVYAAIPRCALSGFSDVDALMINVSHELLEAATDPLSGPQSGYDEVDPDHFVWGPAMHGAEIADLCQYAPWFVKPPEIGYAISGVWSNTAARVYHDPCVPASAGAYFNTAIPTSDVALNTARTTKGISVTVGKPLTFDVLFFSDAATSGPWTIAAKEWQLNPKDPLILDLKLDKTSGTNGEKAHLTVTSKMPGPSGRSSILVTSKLGSRESFWFTWVAVQ